MTEEEALQMSNGKEILEKIWWVIPPVVVFFGLPIFHILYGTITSGYPYASLDRYMYGFGYIVGYAIHSLYGAFIIISTVTFMGIGYYISRQKSLSLRILM